MYRRLTKLLGKSAADFILKLFLAAAAVTRRAIRAGRIWLNRVLKVFRTKPLFYLIGVPVHGNMGDQLIAYAEIEWLKDNYGSYPVIEITHTEMLRDKGLKLLLSQIKKNDLIMFHGGGNFGDRYIDSERFRRLLLGKLKTNKILQFPQTISYSDTEDGKKQKENTFELCDSHPFFVLAVREEGSYKTATDALKRTKILLCPDIATYLFGKPLCGKRQRKGVLFCLRDDKEKFLEDGKITGVLEVVSQKYSVQRGDTHIGRQVPKAAREHEIKRLLSEFTRYEVVVTDRFHGIIYSLLAGTPCVALRSADHKITEGIKWFKDCQGLFFAEKAEDVPQLIEVAKTALDFEPINFSNYFDEFFKQTAEVFL